MTRVTRIRRFVVQALLACALAVGVSPAPVLAQGDETAAQAQAGGGESWYGYAAFGFVAVFVLFVVCKSARRG